MRTTLQKSLLKKAAGLLLVVALCTFTSLESFAIIRTFKTGGNSRNWSNPSDWSPSVVPVALDDVVIPSNADAIISSGFTAVCLSIDIEGSLNNAGTINVGGGASSLVGTLVNSGAIDFGATATFNSSKAFSGTFTFDPN